MSSVITSVAALIVTLGLLIAFHEFGHFWVARRCGVKVLRFSIGFGKPLWLKKSGPDQTEFVLAMIPLGGYVKMLDEREGEVAPEEAHRAFNRQSVAKRSAIVAAGPIFNFIFAILAYFILFNIGIPGMKPIIGEVKPDSVAAKAGFKVGDEIIAVNGETTLTLNSARLNILQSALSKDAFDVVVRDPNNNEHKLRLDLGSYNADELQQNTWDIVGLKPEIPPLILGNIDPEGAAARDGFREGDHILRVNGAAVTDFMQWVTIIRANPEKPLQVDFERDGNAQSLTLTPKTVKENGESVGKIMAGYLIPESYKQKMRSLEKFTVTESFIEAVAKTWQLSSLTLKMMGKMIVGEVSLKNLSGPITIATYAGQTASIGFVTFLSFLALVSVSLGVLNLLPIPILDGGHLLNYALELIKGSPLSEAVQVRMQQAGMLMLGMLMMLAIYNDIYRLL